MTKRIISPTGQRSDVIEAIQPVILEILRARPTHDGLPASDVGSNELSRQIALQAPQLQPPSGPEIYQAVLALERQGLVYVNYSTTPPRHQLTIEGELMATESHLNGYFAEKYVNRVKLAVPEISRVALVYLGEAVSSYTNRNYLAAAVMLGIASEAACNDLFATVAQSTFLVRTENKRNDLLDPKKSIYGKMSIIQDATKNTVKGDLGNGLDVQLFAVADFLRVSRNEVGHPTGITPNRPEVFNLMQLYIPMARKLYDLRSFVQSRNN